MDADINSNYVRYDRGAVSKAIITDEGFLKAHAVVTRAGIFEYINADGSIRKELRHPKDVFQASSLSSMKMRPITNGHPTQRLVNSGNIKELAVGYTGETINTDGDFISTTIMVTDPTTVREITSKKKNELSLGYTVDLVKEDGTYNGEPYTHRQTNIRYNHLALVDKARAGPEARIHLDSNDAIEKDSINNDYEYILKENEMDGTNLASVNLDGISYKAAPEVVNAFQKASDKISKMQAKYDAAIAESEKLKAEKDALSQKLDEAAKVDLDAKIHEGVMQRTALIEDVKKILGSKAMNMDSLTNSQIKASVVKEKCPQVNVDQASQIYIDARFDMLKEMHEDAATQESPEFGNQRQAVVTKMDATPKVDPRKAMQERLYNKGAPNRDAEDKKEKLYNTAGKPSYMQNFCNK